MGALGLRHSLSDEDGEEDLGLARIGDSIPSIKWFHGGEGLKGDVLAELAGEVDSGAVDKVSGGGKHGSAAVLELGGAVPAEGLLAARRGEAEGIKVLDRHGATRHIIETHGGKSGRGLSPTDVCI